jgi:hypothetical protein
VTLDGVLRLMDKKIPGGQIDKNKCIAIEFKLNDATPLTTFQTSIKNKVNTTSNLFNIRNTNKISQQNDDAILRNVDMVKIESFIKVWSDGNGNILDVKKEL